MKETLRPFMMKKLIIRMAVAAAIAAGCLLFTRFSIIDVIKGPVEIDMTEDPSKYEGKYVTTEVNYLITDYVEHMTETTYSYGGKTTSKNGNSYIAFYADDDYETMTSKWYYYSLYLPERKLAEANEMIDSTWEFWGDETNTALPPTPMRVTGTWEKLKGDVLRYYTETLRDDLGILEDGDDIFLLYTISADKIGGSPQVISGY